MTVITTTEHLIRDSSGQLAEGLILFRQSARGIVDGDLVTTTPGTVTVKNGRIAKPNPFNLPATAEGDGVEIVEVFRNRGERTPKVYYWVEVPAVASIEYADLPQITPPSGSSGVPAWATQVLTALAEAEAAQAASEAARDVAVTAADDAATLINSLPEHLDTEDGAIAALVSSGSSETNAALSTSFEGGNGRVVYCGPDGNDALFHGLTKSAPKKTLAGALAAMGAGVKGVIRLLPGDVSAGSTVDWTGYHCGLVGVSSLACRIVATAQTGPVLDLTGVGYDLNGTDFGGFSIIGDGTAGAAKKGLALDPDTSVILASFHDITVRNTGGTPFDLGYAELCTFVSLKAYEPVDAESNDIPYFYGGGAFNGNTFRDCQINGVSAGANVGASGALVIEDNGATTPHSNLLDAFKLNYLHLPTDATALQIAGNGNTIRDLQVFDTGKEVGATGTSIVRFSPPAVSNFGGNQVIGFVPGRGGATNDFDYGVDIRQSRNAVRGVKGYNGYNVVLAATVGLCFIDLQGAISSATNPGVVDNSAVLTNIIIDGINATQKLPVTTFQHSTASFRMDQVAGGAFAGMPRFVDPATPANGGVMMGTSGSRWQAAGTTMTGTADQVNFRDIALATLLGVTKAGGVKGLKFYTSASLPTASATYRGQMGWVEGGAGVADRLVMCAKDSSDAYAWVDLI